MRRSNVPAAIAALVATAALAAGGGAALYAALSDGDRTVVRQVTVEGSEPAAATSSLSIGGVYKHAYKSVVEIRLRAAQQLPSGGSERQLGQGSGFVYDDDGHIVTNHHVVDGASSISVTLWNGATYPARIVGSDASTDLAVLDVSAPPSLLSPLRLADSDDVDVGDTVVAIGAPFGLEETVTSGIVSALHRQMRAPNDFTIDDSIQTDAAINHGNSGGPLLDLQARVIGVAAQIESNSGGNDGVGFAIPANTVRSIVSRLVETGKVEHAYLGVGIDTIPASLASRLGMAAGAEVTEVRGGTPAAEAGLFGATGSRTIGGRTYATGGDVITRFDGRKIASADALRAAIDSKRPGDTVSITYSRRGRTHTVRVKLTARPS